MPTVHVLPPSVQLVLGDHPMNRVIRVIRVAIRVIRVIRVTNDPLTTHWHVRVIV